MRKIIDITFWVSFISAIIHFFIWNLIKESGDSEFVKQTINIFFWSGGVTVFSYWVAADPPSQEKDD